MLTRWATKPNGSHRALVLAWATAALVLVGASCGDDGTTGTGGSGGATSSSTTSSGMTTSGSGLPFAFVVTGVVTDGVAPLPGALVLQGGGEVQVVTGADGTFSVELTHALPGEPLLVAAKEGFRSAGVAFDALPTEPVTLALLAAEGPDNDETYTFGHPGFGDGSDPSTAFCGHCHTTFAAQFQTSAHARATRDPLVQDLYAGVASSASTAQACDDLGGVLRDGTLAGSPGIVSKRCYVGTGVLPDLNPCGVGPKACDDPTLAGALTPTQFGRCADCHAIGMNGPLGGRNLLDAEDIAFDHGNHCDACHHVSDVDLDAPPGVGGRLRMQRPREHESSEIGAPLAQVMYGPHPDVVNPFMGGSYQPKFRTAELCAGCHQYEEQALLSGQQIDPVKWPSGLPIHDTFGEWRDSTWNDPATPCQSCHMPPLDGVFNSVDVSTPDEAGPVGGFRRAAGSVRSHAFIGPLAGTPRLLDVSAAMTISSVVTATEIDVTVAIDNIGAGHALPTGEPMRAMILVVEVDGCDGPLDAVSGMTVPPAGGLDASITIGAQASVSGTTLSWSAHPAVSAGAIVRIVRPTGTFDDYVGVGRFGDAALPAADKGMEIFMPVGEAMVVSTDADTLTLDRALVANPGDIVYVGDSISTGDADPSRAFAGAPGYAFAKILIDPSGARAVGHHRAIDIASDNRIPPGERATTNHGFALPTGCANLTLHATLLYRPLPHEESRRRGWDARDHVILRRTETLAL